MPIYGLKDERSALPLKLVKGCEINVQVYKIPKFENLKYSFLHEVINMLSFQEGYLNFNKENPTMYQFMDTS